MPWTYHQQTGNFFDNGVFLVKGYSGAGKTRSEGRNNPAMEMLAGKGPIPAGTWEIGPAYDHRGPRYTHQLAWPVMNLTPVGHLAYYRSDFRIHGDNTANDASNGCIILPLNIRILVAFSTDRTLIVVA